METIETYTGTHFKVDGVPYPKTYKLLPSVNNKTLSLVNNNDSSDFIFRGREIGQIEIDGTVYETMEELFAGISPNFFFNFGSVVGLTHSELLDKIENSLLLPEQSYEITDYVTKYIQPITGIENTGTPEMLTLKAISTNELYPFAYSSAYPNDIIRYDVNDAYIFGDEIEGEMEEGSDTGGGIIISNIVANGFDVNKNLSENYSGFTVFLQDDSTEKTYTITDIGTTWNIEDLGGGQYRHTFDNVVDLTNEDYNYATIVGKEVVSTRNGYITERINTEYNYSKPYDFRNVKFRRYKIDQTTLAWNSGTTYAAFKIVTYNDNLYVSIQNANLNHLPSDTSYWYLIQTNILYHYFLYDSLVLLDVNVITPDLAEYKDFYCYSTLNTTTGGVTFLEHESIRNIKESYIIGGTLDNNVLIVRNTDSRYFKNLSFGDNFLNNTFLDCNIIDSIFHEAFSNNIVFNLISCEVGGNSINNYIYYLKQSKIGVDSQYNFFKSVYDSELGNQLIKNILVSVVDTKAGNNFYKNMLKTSFYRNIIGDTFQNNLMYYIVQDNIIGSQFKANNITDRFTDNIISSQFYSNTITGDFVENIISSKFYSNTIGQFKYCKIGAEFYSNTIGSYCYQLSTFGSVYSNTFNYITNVRILTQLFDNNTFNAGINDLIVYVYVRSTDFSSATNIYNAATKEIRNNISPASQLIWYDAAWALQNSNVNA